MSGRRAPADLINEDRLYRAWIGLAWLSHSPLTILEELKLQMIQSTDVALLTTDGLEVRRRCVVRPNQAQAMLLERLGVDLPQRLRVIPTLAGTIL